MNALVAVEMVPARPDAEPTCPSCCPAWVAITPEMKPCARCAERVAAVKACARHEAAAQEQAAKDEHAAALAEQAAYQEGQRILGRQQRWSEKDRGF